MYDDYDNYYPDYPDPEVSSWSGNRLPGRGEVVHLCPECRDLMSSIASLARRLPEPTPEPDWSRALRWLDAVCGGRDAVLALGVEPLTGAVELPAGLPVERRQRLDSCLTLLDATARRFLDEEAGVALARGLLRLHEREPGVVVGTSTASQLTLGVVWAVGHANGLLHPRGVVTEKELKPYLNATQSGSKVGRQVRDALVGPFAWTSPTRSWTYGGGQSRDLEPLGHVDLLVARVRRQLIDVRDRALAAAALAREPAA